MIPSITYTYDQVDLSLTGVWGVTTVPPLLDEWQKLCLTGVIVQRYSFVPFIDVNQADVINYYDYYGSLSSIYWYNTRSNLEITNSGGSVGLLMRKQNYLNKKPLIQNFQFKSITYAKKGCYFLVWQYGNDAKDFNNNANIIAQWSFSDQTGTTEDLNVGYIFLMESNITEDIYSNTPILLSDSDRVDMRFYTYEQTNAIKKLLANV